jgi:hypothetical protein
MTIEPKEANAIVATYDKLHRPFDWTERLRNDPPLLAHYTSVQVIEQIIKNEEIWLSHPFFMNDLEELRFGMLQGIQHFPSYAQSAASTPASAQILLDRFMFYVGHMNEKTLVDTYVLCLSEHPPHDTDGVLSMWRSYASQGHGAALVINTRNIPDPPQAPLRIAKVIYGSPADRVQLLRNGLDEWAKITKAANLPEDKLYLAAYGAFSFVKSFALMTKHSGFKEEAEWRIIYVPELDPEGLLVRQFSYHISPRGAEPKLKFKIAPVQGQEGAAEPLSLAKLVQFIILGPSIASPIAQEAFRRVLKNTCLHNFEDRVFASAIPLRPTVG